MAIVYLDMDALYAYQQTITQQIPILNAQLGAKDNLIEQTIAETRRAIFQAEEQEQNAANMLRHAENQLAEAERHTAQINRNLGPDQAPAETPEYYYESVAEKEEVHRWAERHLENARDTLERFENYVRSYRRAQEDGIDAYQKCLTQSANFVSSYIKLLIEAKKCTNFGYSGSANVSVGPANGAASGGNSYEKTIFTGTVMGQSVQRTVYINTSLDPNMVVPEGTRFGNNKVVSSDTTNLTLMQNGQAPFVISSSGNLVQLELHHLSGRESLAGASYFGSSDTHGGMVEIAADVHDQNSAILHIPKKPGDSFRVDSITGGVSNDSKFYSAFRKAYWKQRASAFQKS